VYLSTRFPATHKMICRTLGNSDVYSGLRSYEPARHNRQAPQTTCSCMLVDRCVPLLSRVTVLYYQRAEKTNFMCRINNYIYFLNILIVKVYISVLTNITYITQSSATLVWLNTRRKMPLQLGLKL